MAALEWNPFALLPLACFLSSLVIAVLVGSRRPPGPTFVPVCVGIGLWSLIIAILACTDDVDVGDVASRVAMTTVLLVGAFAMRYILYFARARRQNLWALVAFLLSGVGVVQVWLDPTIITEMRPRPWGGLYPMFGERWSLFYAIACAGVLVPGFIALRLWLRSPPSRRRRHAAHICLGYGAAVLGAIDILAGLGVELPPLSWFTSTASLYVFYQAMVRWRLIDVRTALHKTLRWGMFLVSGFLPAYGLAELTAGAAFWREPWPRAIVVLAIMGVLLAWIAWAEPFALRIMRRRGERLAAVVDRFAARTAGLRRPAEILAPLGEALAELADLRLCAAVLEVDVGGERKALRLPTGVPALPRPLDQVGRLDEPLSRDDLDSDDAPRLQDLLDAYRADAILPLIHQGAMIGVLFAGSGEKPAVLDEVTREALGRLAARAAVAFINAELEGALEQRSLRLEAEVEERTRALADAAWDLKAAQAQLVQAERQSSLAVLVAGVSHEINNALNFIFGNLPMLQQYGDDVDELLVRAGGTGARPRAELVRRAEEARAGLPATIDAVGRAGERARSIVDDLRRFARRDDGERRPTDVRAGLASTLNLLGPELAGRIEVERHIAPDLPTVDGWPGALNHVFLNVLLNAVQAIDGPGRIVVAAHVEGGELEIQVADSGRGLTAEVRERAFEPFFSTRERAAGLGLAVARQILDRHGGRITLADNPTGHGARVTIRLPIVAT